MQFIHIRSPKFVILPEEEKELVNPDMCGKAIALYLEEKLPPRGYEIPFHCCEDWGWWVSIASVPFHFGVCIYSGQLNPDGLLNFAVTDGALGPRKGSWSKFRFIDTAPYVEKLHGDLLEIFREDPDVIILGINDDATEPPSQ